jgi:hypothetical protein
VTASVTSDMPMFRAMPILMTEVLICRTPVFMTLPRPRTQCQHGQHAITSWNRSRWATHCAKLLSIDDKISTISR